MSTLIYSYKRFGQFLRPVIYVDLHYKKTNRSYYALLDSGADNCIFHGDIGELLGVDVKTGSPTYIGGIASDGTNNAQMITAYLHKIGITIKGETRNINAFFSYDISEYGYGVFGQLDFFNKFKSVKFDYQRGKIEIET